MTMVPSSSDESSWFKFINNHFLGDYIIFFLRIVIFAP